VAKSTDFIETSDFLSTGESWPSCSNPAPRANKPDSSVDWERTRRELLFGGTSLGLAKSTRAFSPSSPTHQPMPPVELGWVILTVGTRSSLESGLPFIAASRDTEVLSSVKATAGSGLSPLRLALALTLWSGPACFCSSPIARMSANRAFARAVA